MIIIVLEFYLLLLVGLSFAQKSQVYLFSCHQHCLIQVHGVLWAFFLSRATELGLKDNKAYKAQIILCRLDESCVLL
jgi:hypothetical protein